MRRSRAQPNRGVKTSAGAYGVSRPERPAAPLVSRAAASQRCRPKYQKGSPMCDPICLKAGAMATSFPGGPTLTVSSRSPSKEMIMNSILSALVALSLLAAVAAPGGAYDPSVGPPTYWTPHDPSPPGSPPG